jgi:hypothetical protein
VVSKMMTRSGSEVRLMSVLFGSSWSFSSWVRG